MKVNNPDWRELGETPTDITLRDQTGVSFAPEDVAQVGATIEHMLANTDEWTKRLRAVRADHIANLGHGGEAAGEYLLSAILRHQIPIREKYNIEQVREEAGEKRPGHAEIGRRCRHGRRRGTCTVTAPAPCAPHPASRWTPELSPAV